MYLNVDIGLFMRMAGIGIEQLIEYVEIGLLFPMTTLQPGVLVRRIPSYFTEHMFGFMSNDEALKTCKELPLRYPGYDLYCEDIRAFSEMLREDAQRQRKATPNRLSNLDFGKRLPPDECIPWVSDFAYTELESVFIDPSAFKAALSNEGVILRRYVSLRNPRIKSASDFSAVKKNSYH